MSDSPPTQPCPPGPPTACDPGGQPEQSLAGLDPSLGQDAPSAARDTLTVLPAVEPASAAVPLRSSDTPPTRLTGLAQRPGLESTADQDSGPASGDVPLTRLTTSGGSPVSDKEGQWPPGKSPPREQVAGYEILGELGRGGMGVVYKARQTRLKRLVALKMILGGSQARRDHLDRFKREAEAVARLHHPNIVQIYEVGEHQGLPFFSLEYVEGGSLDGKLAGTPLDARTAASLIEVLSRAMHAAHERGIVHRDLKPANVLLAAAPAAAPSGQVAGLGVPKVTDFGLAKQLDDDSGQTRSGAIMGTPCYMAPEQAEGRTRDIAPSTDVYALGAILYELLTGRPPFKGQSVWDTVHQVLSQDPVPPRQLQPKVPRDLETICLKCLSKASSGRYPTALALAEDLRRFLADEPIVARPAGWIERGAKWARRRPALATLAGVILLAILGVAGAIPWHIATLQAKVIETTAEVDRLRQREEDEREGRRRDRVRADCERWLGEGKAALARKESKSLQDARVHLTRVRDKIEARDAREDEGLRAIKEEADRLLSDLGARERAWTREKDFFRLKDEAFFLLNQDLFTVADSAGPRASQETARRALALFGITAEHRTAPDLRFYEPHERENLTTGFYEALLIQAEAVARQRPGQTAVEQRGRVREALRILDRAAQLVPSTQVVHRRRSLYLGLLGQPDAVVQERARAEARQPGTPLDWFLAGYDKGFAAGEGPRSAADLQQAISDFDEALRRQPDLFWAQFFRALAYQKLNNLSESRAGLTICIAQRPGFIWSYLVRGYLSGQLGDFKSAQADFAQAEQMHPDDSARYVLHVNRGYLAVRQGQRARIWAGAAGVAGGGAARAGTLTLAQRHFFSGVADLERAAQLKPSLYHPHVNLAQAYRELQQPERATKELDTAIRLDSSRPSLYRTRAGLRLQMQDSEGALHDLDEAVRLESRARKSLALARDHLERGLIHYKAGRYEEAVRACEEALGVRKGNYPEAHRLQAEALLKLNRYRDAVKAFDRFLEKGRPDAEVFRKRALASAELGDYTASADEYTRALALQPSPRVHVARGWVYLTSNAPRLALRDFEEALKAEPHNADAYAGRGFARAKLGDHRGAAADAEEVLHRGRHSTRLLYNAARTFAQAAVALDADPHSRNPLGQEARALYQGRAVGLLRDALALLPASERGSFWRDYVWQDPAFVPLYREGAFNQLAAKAGPVPR